MKIRSLSVRRELYIFSGKPFIENQGKYTTAINEKAAISDLYCGNMNRLQKDADN